MRRGSRSTPCGLSARARVVCVREGQAPSGTGNFDTNKSYLSTLSKRLCKPVIAAQVIRYSYRLCEPVEALSGGVQAGIGTNRNPSELKF